MIFSPIASQVERFRWDTSVRLGLTTRPRPTRAKPMNEIPAARFIMKSLFRAARFGIESLRGSGVSSAREGGDHARRWVRGARYRGFDVDGRLLARPPAALGASRHD